MDELAFDEISILLDQVAAFRKEFNGLMKATAHNELKDLSILQFHLLNIIYSNTPCNQKEIAQEAHVSKATLSVRLDKLVDAGLITRKVDKNDKRNYILMLTPFGKEKMLAGREVMHSSLLPVLKGFEKEDIVIISNYLNKMKLNIQEIKEEM